jgi:SAM-dependent methyltransferase
MNDVLHPDPISPFWKDPDTVDSFANRDPDRRLVQLLDSYADPPSTRVLDLGCAGGRNCVLLAERGFDFQAVDGSWPMMTRTRKRIAGVCGEAAAQDRVRAGVMEDLSEFADGTFDLIVALGIYHQALSFEHWQACVAESARVLKNDGLVLISSFTPRSQPEGSPLVPIPGLDNMYGGFSSGPLCIFEPADHDVEMANHGFEPHVPTETVRIETELGFRVTMNALYRKRGTSI